MKVSSIAIILWYFFSFAANAGDVLELNKKLYEKANNGDVKSMQLLSRYYINQYSLRWNPERSRYWACRIYQLERTAPTELDCKSLLKTGEKKAITYFLSVAKKLEKLYFLKMSWKI